jgi:hypothetical protein
MEEQVVAVVRIPEENRSLHEPDQVRDFLAGMGIDYERWWPSGELPPDASAEQILRAYAKQLDQLKAQGGYVTADVIDVGPWIPCWRGLASSIGMTKMKCDTSSPDGDCFTFIRRAGRSSRLKWKPAI